MSTLSMTYIISDWDNKTPMLTFYRHCDGYPEGHGADLCSFLTKEQDANGYDDHMGQLFATLKSANLKYNIYPYPLHKLPTKKQTLADYRDKYLLSYATDCGCEFTYIIRNTKEGQIEIQVFKGRENIFTGTPQEMVNKFSLELDD